ncbi:hypothetical protein VQ643_02700 [Pseudomonas sp. F1_0610]|uniref:hypothetical protein n=1 Tax=Pseudomonas sp. F1_0610 TaxID=3114284 RepID=UPI0039C3CEEC
MLKQLTSILLIGWLLAGCASQQTQLNTSTKTLERPAQGQVLVHFIRANDFSNKTAAIYNRENYLVSLNKGEHFTYATTPGRHVFMVTGGTPDVMTASLEANKVYFVHVKPTLGALKVNFDFKPYTVIDPKKKAQAQLWMQETNAVTVSAEGKAWAAQHAAQAKAAFDETYSDFLKRKSEDRTHIYKEDGL